MNNIKTALVLFICLFTLSGCETYKASEIEKAELYHAMLSNFDGEDCNPEELECQKNFLSWQDSKLGKAIIANYEEMKNDLKVLTPHLQQSINSVYCESDCKGKGKTLLDISQSQDLEHVIQYEAIINARNDLK